MEVKHNFTVGYYMAIGEGTVAETLMARDYKDPQCVMVVDDGCFEQADCRDVVRERIPGQTDASGCDQRDVSCNS